MKYRIEVLVAATLFLWSSCKPEPAPISIPAMASVLKDLHFAESYTQVLPFDSLHPVLNRQDSLNRMNAMIYQQHHLTETQFREALQWYQNHPVFFDSVYQIILNDISIQQARSR
ncbi:MAG TPA: DUF4296 domain-containing protein [Chitinophagaceae bacterium]|nr:DUF4296 domain-containing protein [Chitinophagaceae bacterium]